MQTGQGPLHIVSSRLLQRFVTQLLEQGNASAFVAGKGLLGAARAQAGNERGKSGLMIHRQVLPAVACQLRQFRRAAARTRAAQSGKAQRWSIARAG